MRATLAATLVAVAACEERVATTLWHRELPDLQLADSATDASDAVLVTGHRALPETQSAILGFVARIAKVDADGELEWLVEDPRLRSMADLRITQEDEVISAGTEQGNSWEEPVEVDVLFATNGRELSRRPVPPDGTGPELYTTNDGIRIAIDDGIARASDDDGELWTLDPGQDASLHFVMDGESSWALVGNVHRPPGEISLFQTFHLTLWVPDGSELRQVVLDDVLGWRARHVARSGNALIVVGHAEYERRPHDLRVARLTEAAAPIWERAADVRGLFVDGVATNAAGDIAVIANGGCRRRVSWAAYLDNDGNWLGGGMIEPSGDEDILTFDAHLSDTGLATLLGTQGEDALTWVRRVDLGAPR